MKATIICTFFGRPFKFPYGDDFPFQLSDVDLGFETQNLVRHPVNFNMHTSNYFLVAEVYCLTINRDSDGKYPFYFLGEYISYIPNPIFHDFHQTFSCGPALQTILGWAFCLLIVRYFNPTTEYHSVTLIIVTTTVTVTDIFVAFVDHLFIIVLRLVPAWNTHEVEKAIMISR
jgi:hypothetical protein